jgi:hypothetical protein
MGFTHQSREAGGLEIEIPSNQDESPIIVSRDKGNKCKTKQDFRSEKVRKQIEYASPRKRRRIYLCSFHGRFKEAGQGW